MKKIFLLLLLCSFGFISCTKCRECTQTTTVTTTPLTSGYPTTTVVKFEACGDYLKSIDGKNITSTTTSSSSNLKVNTTVRTLCN